MDRKTNSCFEEWGSVGIEKDKFIAVELKSSEHGTGKLLIGPEGTFAYIIKLNEDLHRGNGRWSRLVFFPHETAMAHFDSFGWKRS